MKSVNERRIYTVNVFWRFIPVNIVCAILLYFFDAFYTHMFSVGFVKSFSIFAITFFCIQFCLELIVIFPLTRDVKKNLNYFISGGSTEKDRTDFVRNINKFPIKKFIEGFILFFIGSLIPLCILSLFYSYKVSDIVALISGSWYISYLAAIIDFSIAQRICSKFASTVVAAGINEQVVKKERFFGVKLSIVSMLYIVNTVVVTGIFMFFAAFSPTNVLFMVIFCFVISIAIVVYGSVMYFKYQQFYNNKIQHSLEVVTVNTIADFNLEDNIKDFDMCNEITYSMFLTSKTIDMFLRMIEHTKKLNKQLISQSSGLYSSSEKTQEIISTQVNDITEVINSVAETENLSDEIKKRVDEVNIVATKTNSDVDFCIEAVQSNLSKMKEIISANQTTIQGIHDLANKITTVREIINLIDTVAEQTKIIAFNTEMEAESIKSNDEVFFNLATEIRSLADSTMDLTRQIREQIKEIQQSTMALVVTGQKCTKKITAGNNFMLTLEKRFKNLKVQSEKAEEYSTKINSDLRFDDHAFEKVINKLNNITEKVHSFNNNSKQVLSIVNKLKDDTSDIESLKLSSN